MSAQSNLLAQYVEFCASPLRDAASIEAEFDQLRSNPDVGYIGFHKPHILALGTLPLIIPWKGIEYGIGEFIIFLIRKREGRVWETGFRFANITNAINVYDGDDILREIIMHPHIITTKYEDVGVPTGELCISGGQFVIYQSLRKGFVNRAFSHLWEALKIYGTGKPYHEVEDWPFLLQEEYHD